MIVQMRVLEVVEEYPNLQRIEAVLQIAALVLYKVLAGQALIEVFATLVPPEVITAPVLLDVITPLVALLEVPGQKCC